MGIFGVDNVRGGTYCNVDISKSLNRLTEATSIYKGSCYNCKMVGHFDETCPVPREPIPTETEILAAGQDPRARRYARQPDQETGRRRIQLDADTYFRAMMLLEDMVSDLEEVTVENIRFTHDLLSSAVTENGNGGPPEAKWSAL